MICCDNLFHASTDGHVECIQNLIQQDGHGVHINGVDHDTKTPLHIVSEYGHLDCMRILIEHGANVQAKDGEEWTPLHIATWNGHLEGVKLLMLHGAKINARTNEGATPLHHAVCSEHIDMVGYLIGEAINISAHIIDEINDDGWTALHDASALGHIEIVKLLLDNYADSSILTHKGASASVIARNNEIRMLIQNHEAMPVIKVPESD